MPATARRCRGIARSVRRMVDAAPVDPDHAQLQVILRHHLARRTDAGNRAAARRLIAILRSY